MISSCDLKINNHRLWVIKAEVLWHLILKLKSKEKTKEGKVIMEKLKKFIVNLKVAGKLKAYRVTVLTMTVFLVAVALTQPWWYAPT